VNKLYNVNVNYLKIPKKRHGSHAGHMFEIPGLDGWKYFFLR